MTKRSSSGGVLNQSFQIDATRKTLVDLLKDKYSEPAYMYVREKALLQCYELLPLVDMNVTGAHVEKVAQKIHGGAVLQGTTALQRHDFLRRYEAHSERLRHA